MHAKSKIIPGYLDFKTDRHHHLSEIEEAILHFLWHKPEKRACEQEIKEQFRSKGYDVIDKGLKSLVGRKKISRTGDEFFIPEVV